LTAKTGCSVVKAKAYYKEGNISIKVDISTRVGISTKTGISTKVGIKASPSKDIFRPF
jgi:hypothetical protein